MASMIECLRQQQELPLLPWDDYYLTMAQTDFLLGRHHLRASKTFSIRKAPFGGSYAHLAGLHSFIRVLKDYRFDEPVCSELRAMGYDPHFIDYLSDGGINVETHAIREGDIIFPHEPAVVIEGSLPWVRLAEGIMLPELNFPTLSLTKWQRVVRSADPGYVLEFARRRAQDPTRSSIYAHIAGCHFSSNADVKRGFKCIEVRGTMGHEWVQSFGNESLAFDRWLEINPKKPVLLVDTIDTLRSGIGNAIRSFTTHRESIRAAGGHPGIRIDSGDLAYLTIEARRILDHSGLDDALIYLTNDLDERSITSIREQVFTQSRGAGLDPHEVLSRMVWGCGTVPGTCSDQPSLGGVAKLSSIDVERNGTPEHLDVIKLSRDNPSKTSIPGSNRSSLVWRGDELVCCLVHGHDEDPRSVQRAYHPDDQSKTIDISGLQHEPRHIPQHMINDDVDEIRHRVSSSWRRLHWTQSRLQSPHTVKVSLSPSLFRKRKAMLDNGWLMDGGIPT